MPERSDYSVQSDPDGPGSGDDPQRRAAIRQIQRRRAFQVRFVMASLAMLVLVFIWAIAEYQNAGGWPTNGFSQSSGIHDTWNYWIIYPFIAYLVFVAACAWIFYGRKPISEREIEREMKRRSGER